MMHNIPVPVYHHGYHHGRVFPEQCSTITEEERKIPDEEKSVRFERELTFVSAVNFILNYVIGTGIFVSPGTILEECGSIGMSFVLWSICAVMSLITVLPFAELCTVVPKSGSQYVYIQEAFKDFHPFYGQMPGFIYIWVNFIFMRPASFAIHSLLSAEYMYAIFIPAVSEEFDTHYSFLIKNFIGSVSLIIIGLINCQSVKIYIISQDLITYFKMLLCLALILVGAYMFMSEQAINFDMGFDNTTLTVARLPLALYAGLYAFDGGSIVTGLTEEIKNPERTILRSLIMGLGVVTVTYLLLNLSFLSVLTVDEITTSSAVAKLFAEKVFGVQAGLVVSILVSFSSVGGNLSGIFYSSRLGYAAAKEGHMMEFLCYIHRTRLTPTPAVILQVTLSLVFYYVGKSAETLINVYSFVLWLNYGFTMVALIILRVKNPQAWRPYKVPLVIPVAVLLISWLLVVTSLVTQPATTYFTAVVVLITGIKVQYWFVYKKRRIVGLTKLTTKLQKWLDVVPPS